MNGNQRLLLFSSLLSFCFISLYGQEIEPCEEKALLVILVVDEADNPIEKAEVTISNPDIGVVIDLLTSKDGMCEVLVPNGHGYTIGIGQVKNADYVEVPDEAYYELALKYYIDSEYAYDLSELNVSIYVATNEGVPVSETFEVVSLVDRQIYEVNSDLSGNARIELPAGQNYQVNFIGAENYMRFSVPDKPRHFRDIEIEYGGHKEGRLHPTLDKMLVGIHYSDFDSLDVANEVIDIRGLDEGTAFQVKTNEEGWAWVQLLRGDRYVFSTSVLGDFQRISVPATEQLEERITKINFLSSGDYHDYMAYIKGMEEKMEEGYADSIRRMQQRARSQSTRVHNPNPRRRVMQPEERYKVIEEKAQKEKKEIENDFTYFIRQAQEVNAVFYRFIDQWVNKVVVVDVTCSMDPYVDQVLSWIAMQLSKNEKSQFIFFNDGDGKPLHEKVIGATGGFHYTGSSDIDTILNTLYYAESFGCSGDVPENDLEALLYSTSYMDEFSELILIADNFSSVRDMELLKDLDVPVRIVLCGFRRFVHPHYLEIAYHTDGSIHTVEEDILDFRTKVDNDEVIRISNTMYRYRYGKFVPERFK
ncbi:MAG: hypothetical protein EA408_00090 [Marinilabiliales bacterium]|nr:MAG: hypothetical protein EA408_00090 [Marinilabiliales bacterium]